MGTMARGPESQLVSLVWSVRWTGKRGIDSYKPKALLYFSPCVHTILDLQTSHPGALPLSCLRVYFQGIVKANLLPTLGRLVLYMRI